MPPSCWSLLTPGRGQSVPMCVSCAPLAVTMMILSTSSCHDVPGHVTPTSLRSLFRPCQNFSVNRSNWGHHFFPGAVRCFPGFPFKINFLSLGPPSRIRFGKTKLILLSQQDQLGHAGDDQDQGLLWAPVRGVKEQGQWGWVQYRRRGVAVGILYLCSARVIMYSKD